MPTIYYVDSNGNYVGGFCGNTGIDTSQWTEVPYPPPIATYMWDGTQWISTDSNGG